MKKLYLAGIVIVVSVLTYFVVAYSIGLWPFFRSFPITWTCHDGTEVNGGYYNCPDNGAKDSRCNWNAGVCLALIPAGYYYDYPASECKYFEGGSGCSGPPFQTLEDCESVCNP
jgi:hypothetical protein